MLVSVIFCRCISSDVSISFCIFCLAFWASVSMVVQRYHDRVKSGIWYFIAAVPYVGMIWQFVGLVFLPGDDVENDFGQPPGTQRSHSADEMLSNFALAQDNALTGVNLRKSRSQFGVRGVEVQREKIRLSSEII